MSDMDVYEKIDTILADIEYAKTLGHKRLYTDSEGIQWRPWTASVEEEPSPVLSLLRQAHRDGWAQFLRGGPEEEVYMLPWDMPGLQKFPAAIDPNWWKGMTPGEIKAGPLAEEDEIKAATAPLKGLETKRRNAEASGHIPAYQKEINRKLEEGLRLQELREAQSPNSDSEEEGTPGPSTTVANESNREIIVISDNSESAAEEIETSISHQSQASEQDNAESDEDVEMEEEHADDTQSEDSSKEDIDDQEDASDKDVEMVDDEDSTHDEDDLNNVVVVSDADPTHRPGNEDRVYFLVDPGTTEGAEKIRCYEGTVKSSLSKLGVEVDQVTLPAGYAYYGFVRPHDTEHKPDMFLYGHPGHYRFRSGMEFARHYQFLLEKAAGRNSGNAKDCRCLYCNRPGKAPKS